MNIGSFKTRIQCSRCSLRPQDYVALQAQPMEATQLTNTENQSPISHLYNMDTQLEYCIVNDDLPGG